MRFTDLFYMFIGFSIVMVVLQGAGLVNTGFTMGDYLKYFGAITIVTTIGGLITAAGATFLRPNSTPERGAMYVLLAPIVGTFFASAFIPFYSMIGMIPKEGQGVATALLSGVVLIIGVLVFFWLFQLVFGGGESYE